MFNFIGEIGGGNCPLKGEAPTPSHLLFGASFNGAIMKEIWKDIDDFIGIYQVSNLGRIKRVRHSIWNKANGSFSSLPEIVMKPDNKGKSYYQINLHKDGKVKKLLLHRIVASAFIDNPLNLPQVNHKNFDKLDNRASNLEWVTDLQNKRHAWENGKYNNRPRGEDRPHILTQDEVYQIKRAVLRNKDYCRLFWIHPTTVWHLQNDSERWPHIIVDEKDKTKKTELTQCG